MMIGWMLAIAISTAALIITAAARPGNINMAYFHLIIAACVCIYFALDSLRRARALEAAGNPPEEVAALSMRSNGMVWSWAALVLAGTYGTGVLSWKEWPVHLGGFAVAAGMCLMIAAALSGSVKAGKADPAMLSVARILLIVQLVAMLILIVGFLVDGQMARFLAERVTEIPGPDGRIMQRSIARYVDWPAKNVMFFGAIAIAAVSGTALKLLPRTR